MLSKWLKKDYVLDFCCDDNTVGDFLTFVLILKILITPSPLRHMLCGFKKYSRDELKVIFYFSTSLKLWKSSTYSVIILEYEAFEEFNFV